MAKSKILILTGDTAESLEVMYPISDCWRKATRFTSRHQQRKNCVLWFMISSPASIRTLKNPATPGMQILLSKM